MTRFMNANPYQTIGFGYSRQRPPGSAPVIQGYAECLPFPDQSFDAAMAILTVHHWTDATAGLAEMRRVSGRQAVCCRTRPERQGSSA
ncbi:class I SAM-dependent methyltransferase [Nonomuraea sp. NBC_00507]|uniref:class I SAM-dependent methyltransferase n=1 Tax=Nonomuraea sp. NBC_00507 TaxID=2976002 RepID=UPI002E19D70E